MKKITFIFLATSVICFSQNYVHSYIQLDTIIQFNSSRVHNRISPIFLMNAFNDNHLIFSDFNYNSPYVCTNENSDIENFNFIPFLVIDLRNFSIKKINIPNTNNLKLIFGFNKNERYFLVADFDSNLIIYEKTPKDEYIYHSQMKLPVLPKQFLHIDKYNSIFFGEVGFSGKELQNGIFMTTINEKKIITSYFPDFAAPEFSFISPRMWYNMTENRIFTSQTIRYEIDVMSKNLKKENSVKRNDFNWESAVEDKLKKAEQIRKKRFADNKWREIIIELDNITGRIIGIFPVNDSSLIVYYSSPDIKIHQTNHFLDVWKFSDGKWELHKKDILLETLKVIQENWLFTKEKYYPMLGMSNAFLFTYDKLIIIDYNVSFDMKNKTWKDFLDYLKNNQNEKSLMVYIYSHSLFD